MSGMLPSRLSKIRFNCLRFAFWLSWAIPDSNTQLHNQKRLIENLQHAVDCRTCWPSYLIIDQRSFFFDFGGRRSPYCMGTFILLEVLILRSVCIESILLTRHSKRYAELIEVFLQTEGHVEFKTKTCILVRLGVEGTMSYARDSYRINGNITTVPLI